MNTANLQIEGVLLALAALTRRLEAKGLLDADEIDAALAEAERTALKPDERASLPQANREAILFPLRFLRAAVMEDGAAQGFGATTREVGRNKPRIGE